MKFPLISWSQNKLSWLPKNPGTEDPWSIIPKIFVLVKIPSFLYMWKIPYFHHREVNRPPSLILIYRLNLSKFSLDPPPHLYTYILPHLLKSNKRLLLNKGRVQGVEIPLSACLFTSTRYYLNSWAPNWSRQSTRHRSRPMHFWIGVFVYINRRLHLVA